jgi:uncharacterized protein (TIGR02145 family)
MCKNLLIVLILFSLSVSCKKEKLPELTTAPVIVITYNSVTSGGNITSGGSSDVIARGVCWNMKGSPTILDNLTVDGAGAGEYTSWMTTGLLAETKIYVRAYATNSSGTVYGNEISFVNISVNQLKDIDNNVYIIKDIGAQMWMTENLRTTKYNDGTSVINTTDNNTWGHLTSAAYCWYNNNESSNKAVYGALYNWYAVNTGKLCPTGWHVPAYNEWIQMINYLGGMSLAGGKLKETGTTYWTSPNTGATNTSGFSARPGGFRDTNGGSGTFTYLGTSAGFWSSSLSGQLPATHARHLDLSYNSAAVDTSSYSKDGGFSVRCVTSLFDRK